MGFTRMVAPKEAFADHINELRVLEQKLENLTKEQQGTCPKVSLVCRNWKYSHAQFAGARF